jgi:hypothetical protein
MNNLFMSVGYVSGTKNSAAVRSGIPISQRVGPFLGGSYTRTPNFTSHPAFEDSRQAASLYYHTIIIKMKEKTFLFAM